MNSSSTSHNSTSFSLQPNQLVIDRDRAQHQSFISDEITVPNLISNCDEKLAKKRSGCCIREQMFRE
jgi:hypothetical protein